MKIGPGLDLPLEAVTETFAILAKRGSGKTYTAAVMVEEMLDAHLPVCVVDPLGVWWGLRASADGKAPGQPVVIFGGEHGDVPLQETAGKLIADVLVEERLPAVIDLSELSKSATRRFMADFAERLYHRNREPLHLVLDEADAFAPQRAAPDGARLLGAIEDLVRRGRARGIGVTLITQRPAVLNKDVLTQAEVLIALRMTGPRDVAAIDEWVRLHADEDEAREVKSSLPSLPIGTAWVWSPGWLGILQRVAVRKRRTFDSSATPKVGEVKRQPARMADVDLAALGEQIAATAEKARADDPKALRSQIADLERQRSAHVCPTTEARVERVEVPAVAPDVVDRLTEAARSLGDVAASVLSALAAVRDAPPVPAVAAPPKALAKASEPVAVPTRSPVTSAMSETLPRAQRKVMTVLAQYPEGRSKTQLAILTGYSVNGGGFNNAIGWLRARNYLEGTKEHLRATEPGLLALGAWEPLPQGDDLFNYWQGQVPKAERLILAALRASHPTSMRKVEIAEQTGYAASGGGFSNALGKLRTLELIKGYDPISLSEDLVA